MFPQLVNRFRGAARAAAVGLLAALVACANAPAPSGESAELSGVRVETGTDATQVVLLGVAGAHPTAVEEQNPARIVVALPTAVAASAEGATPVWDGTLEEVTVSREAASADGALTHVVIGLATDAIWEMQTAEEGLVVRVQRGTTPDAVEPVATSDGSSDPWAGAAPASEMKRASVLSGVSARASGQGVLLELQADGQIEGAKSFVLEQPLRLVVDLPGMKSALSESRVAVEHGTVKTVRVGQHEGKVRVVVDGADGATSFGEKSAPHAGGLWLALAGAELPASAEMLPVAAASDPVELRPNEAGESAPAEVAAAEPAAAAEAAPVAKAAESTGKATLVHGVQLDSVDGHDRVVIVTDAPAEYVVSQVDDKSLMVQLRGARIVPEAAVRLTPEQPGVVAMVAAFEQPELATPEVRVVVERTPGVEPVVTQYGTMLMLDFAGASAAPVPVVAAAAGETPPGVEAVPANEGAASAKAMKQARLTGQPGPAAIDPNGHGIEVLAEGGLLEGKVYTGRRISLDFKDVEIDDVLRLIAEVSDLNIIAGDEVSGQVTIRLVDVPWDQALDVILLTKGLGFVRVGNVLRIAPGEVLKTEEEARLQEKRAKERLEDLVVKLQPVNYANVKEVSKMVKRLLTPRGTVDIDVRTNTVILKDIASVIDEATALIKAIDTQTPQVMIEAKIVEATLDFLREFGVSWGIGVNPLTTDQIGGNGF